jgi:hypothetical protein
LKRQVKIILENQSFLFLILPLHAHKTKPGGMQIKAPGWPVTEETGLIAFVT